MLRAVGPVGASAGALAPAGAPDAFVFDQAGTGGSSMAGAVLVASSRRKGCWGRVCRFRCTPRFSMHTQGSRGRKRLDASLVGGGDVGGGQPPAVRDRMCS